METHVVIMAGGIGSRLWPVSTPATPKQFIDVLGIGKTMLQLTVERFRPVAGQFWVVTSAEYVPTVREQLPFLEADHILAEPVGRNTAPCIAYACWKIRQRHPDAVVVVTPADALVLETALFADVIRTAVGAVSDSGRIVTVGIEPTRPETGYGYICAQERLAAGAQPTPVKVLSFKEKPDLETAKAYLREGNYFWNAGIFVWHVDTVIGELRRHAPGIAALMDKMAPSFYGEGESAALAQWFPQCEKVSIDYAVMEKSDRIYVIAADLGWSDLGTWDALRQHLPADAQGNAAVGGDVRLIDCQDCVVHADGAETVIVQGLNRYIVAVREGKVLVCSLAEEQHIKSYASPDYKGTNQPE